jgi:hypothetical protein
MLAKDLANKALSSTCDLMKMYLADLSDKDILVRPVPGANHIAWQLAHLCTGEAGLGEILPGVKYPAVPPAIATLGNERTGKVDPPEGYLTKAQYLDCFDKLRAATIAAVDKMSDADLDQASTGDMAKWAPTLGDMLVLMANHTLMHAGQFTVVRRALNKPVVF